VKLTLCLCTPIIVSAGSPLEYHSLPAECFQRLEAGKGLDAMDER
jgi:hypothetical protein